MTEIPRKAENPTCQICRFIRYGLPALILASFCGVSVFQDELSYLIGVVGSEGAIRLLGSVFILSFPIAIVVKLYLARTKVSAKKTQSI